MTTICVICKLHSERHLYGYNLVHMLFASEIQNTTRQCRKTFVLLSCTGRRIVIVRLALGHTVNHASLKALNLVFYADEIMQENGCFICCAKKVQMLLAENRLWGQQAFLQNETLNAYGGQTCKTTL